MTEALRQFGGAEDFTRQWRREWRNAKPSMRLHDVWQAARPALRLLLPALILAPAAIAFAGYFAIYSFLGGPFLLAVFYMVVMGVALLFPVAFGIAQGRRAQRHPGIGMFAALSVEIVGLGTISRLADAFLPNQSPIMQCLNTLLLTAYIWLPIACTTAALTGWWMRRSKARRLA